MAGANGGEIRLLFLVSPQFGELAAALYFAQEPGVTSLLLVPPALYEVHHDTLPVVLEPYESLPEVLVAVDRFRPDLVLLFSGYLFADHRVYTIDNLAWLVEALGERGCRLATSDPFLGLMADLPDQVFSREARAYPILKDYPHVYPADPGELATAEALAYAQPRLVRPPEERSCPAEVRQALDLDPARPRWVFVLAREDYRPAPEFDALLADQLHEALYQGRQPVLVAPPACVRDVARRSLSETQWLGFALNVADRVAGEDWDVDTLAALSQLVARETAGLTLLPFCRYDWFLSLILDAEYVFYWNLFSNSSQLRITNRLPSFFFDRGHMARYSTPLFERCLRCYYLGWEPPCLALEEPLDAGRLAAAAAAQHGAWDAMADNMLSAPPPVEVVRRILRPAV